MVEKGPREVVPNKQGEPSIIIYASKSLSSLTPEELIELAKFTEVAREEALRRQAFDKKKEGNS